MDEGIREALAVMWKWFAWGWAGQTLLPPLWLRRRPRRSSDRAEIALTFDDGPDPRYTLPVLEILERAGVKASFFLVGRKARQHPELVRAIVEEGHDIGNHSYSHIPPWVQTPLAAYRDHMRTNQIIADAAGLIPPFARAPWGFPNLGDWWATVRSRQTYVHWTAQAYDWMRGVTAADICRRVEKQARPGAVVLLHDGTGYPGDPRAMVEALPRVIGGLRQNYQLVPLRQWRGPVRSVGGGAQ